ncbi:hypothetical protein E5288_WYG019152 [Bos mutus]|uniref:Mediator of RNA polymerase II transcription subunit 15 n=1 Tax=Bos mutus TaxID=72004 RepID=A0A6B0S5Y1_9CETA|nr:hypothetical protein [Bos mutus]
MDVSGQETDWRSPTFRQKLVSQIFLSVLIRGAMRGSALAAPVVKWREGPVGRRGPFTAIGEDAMRKAGVAHSKSSKDMESHVFLKAKTRDEYLSLVARLIIHFRDIHNKKSQASVSGFRRASVRGQGPVTLGVPLPPGALLGQATS